MAYAVSVTYQASQIYRFGDFLFSVYNYNIRIPKMPTQSTTPISTQIYKSPLTPLALPVNITIPLEPVVGPALSFLLVGVANPPKLKIAPPMPLTLVPALPAINPSTASVVPPTTTLLPPGIRLTTVPETVIAGEPAINVCEPMI
jgi:hypothetical protein